MVMDMILVMTYTIMENQSVRVMVVGLAVQTFGFIKSSMACMTACML